MWNYPNINMCIFNTISEESKRYILTAALDIEPCNGSIDVLGSGHVGVDAEAEYSRQ